MSTVVANVDSSLNKAAHFQTIVHPARRSLNAHTQRQYRDARPDSTERVSLGSNTRAILNDADRQDKQLVFRRVRFQDQRAKLDDKGGAHHIVQNLLRRRELNPRAMADVRDRFDKLSQESRVSYIALAHYLSTKGEYVSPSEIRKLFMKEFEHDALNFDEFVVCLLHNEEVATKVTGAASGHLLRSKTSHDPNHSCMFDALDDISDWAATIMKTFLCDSSAQNDKKTNTPAPLRRGRSRSGSVSKTKKKGRAVDMRNSHHNSMPTMASPNEQPSRSFDFPPPPVAKSRAVSADF